MKDKTLLPCPFCGGEPQEDGGTFIQYYGHERQDYSITCKQCGAEVRCDVGDFKGADAACSCCHDTRKICADKWNRRDAMQSFGNSEQLEPVSPRYTLPNGWIKCSERMPEDMATVIVSNGADIGNMWWDGDNWRSWHEYDSVPEDVTHWMPLPAAPEQEV